MAVDRPDYRLSDAERQEALDALAEHVRIGRLDVVEFDERSARVSAAKLRRDLEPMFSDLPEPTPNVLRADRTSLSGRNAAPARSARPDETRPVQPWQQRLASAAVPLATVAAVVLFFTLARGMIFVFVLPVIVALLAGSLASRGRRRP